MAETHSASPSSATSYEMMTTDTRKPNAKDLALAIDAVSMTKNPCTLSWKKLSYTVEVKKTEGCPDGKKTILSNVSGRCAPGELTAVMGPSGCGKTTLLDILADRVSSGSIQGEIALNGEPRNVKTFRGVTSYVAQEDSLLGSFTVLETLEMAAKLSLPNCVSHQEIITRVQTVIDEMGLRVCEHTLVGDIFRKGISGGQKRRLSIAIELLSEPSILLFDEPTSGLDSASTYNVMKFVTRLCKENMTVICTIHQPSSLVYDMFTNVAILTAGQTVYFGPRVDMLPHFTSLGYVCPGHEDPAEHYISIANTDFEGHGDISLLVSGYAASPVAARLQEAIQTDSSGLRAARAIERVPNSPLRQLVVLLKRNSLDNLRNPGIFWVRLVMYTALSAMMGTMFLSTNDGITAHDQVYLLTYANSIPGYWIWAHYLGFLSYGFEALMHNQFHSDSDPAAQYILDRFGMENVNLGRDLAILGSNAVAFEIIFTWVLYKFHGKERTFVVFRFHTGKIIQYTSHLLYD